MECVKLCTSPLNKLRLRAEPVSIHLVQIDIPWCFARLSRADRSSPITTTTTQQGGAFWASKLMFSWHLCSLISFVIFWMVGWFSTDLTMSSLPETTQRQMSTTKTKHFNFKHPKRKLYRASEPLLSVFMWGINHTVRELTHISIPVMLMPDDFRAFTKIKIDNHAFNKENLPSHFKVS